MKAAIKLSLLIVALTTCANAADDIKLEANAEWHLNFTNLPATLANLANQEKRPAQLTVWLPANYVRERKFPLFLILDGYDGGFGDRLPLRPGTVGSNDFIYVNLPLFRSTYAGTDDSLIVNMGDYDVMSNAYRIVLQELFNIVPNITPEQSALGGFSNGARALGVLLARRDPFILQHFRSFYLVEGGFGSLAACVVMPGVDTALKQSRILLMYGDKPMPDDDPVRIVNDHLARACALNAKHFHFDLTSVVMQGYGHELPTEYEQVLKAWIRDEKLLEAQQK